MIKSKGQIKDETVIPGYRPYFSVIITVYNRENLILRAIDSLIAQNEKDWEAIIVDDGSTDGTYRKISPYLKQFSEITYLKQPHQGWITAKNTGLRASKGKYITFLDSDDEFDPVHLESRKLILMHNPSVKFLYGGAKITGNQYVPDRFDPRKKINLNECVIGGTFFIERNTAISLNGFTELPLGEDADFLDRAKEAGISIKEIRQPTYIYHHETEDSVTNRMLKIS